MSRENLDMSASEVAAHAPHPQSFYNRFDEDDLEYIEDRWPSDSGYVCLVRAKFRPNWIMVQQTPDIGLMKSWLDRWSPDPAFDVIATHRVANRFQALDLARRLVG